MFDRFYDSWVSPVKDISGNGLSVAVEAGCRRRFPWLPLWSLVVVEMANDLRTNDLHGVTC